MRSCAACVLLAIALSIPTAVAAQDAEEQLPRSFLVETRAKLDRKTFLTPENAFSLAVVVGAGEGKNTQKSYAQNAKRLAPLNRNNCMFVEARSIIGGNVWFMINNAAIDDADASSRDLKVKVYSYAVADSEGTKRSLLRATEFPDVKFVTNPSIEKDEDPSVRVVFKANASALQAMRVVIKENGNPDFDDRLAGSYLLIFNSDVLDDGVFPECKRKRIGVLSWFFSRRS
ncbi:hypothetical protein J5277_01055 [Rhizobium sp. 16-449-1b]|uniref:hypothetical protein n=1 Tax=Rhizobium sp. 16-449-1b TaxID=2819989 RepID=UPI001ADC6B61|nr:hypothetical protein [Rhizobium sp. 16-449-1b]MBO9192684.1 hypothetical protein [Rhizobium sp. 16-449-1b]